MAYSPTTLLSLPIITTGTESGAWGNITNNGLTSYLDIAIAGMNSLTSANFTAGALTIANTQGDSSATNIAAGSAQYATIRVSSLAVNSTITAPGSNRSYRIINADATYSLTIKASGQTGVTFLPGQTGVVAFNGTDYVIVGVVGAGSTTDNTVPRFDGTTGEILQSSGVTIDDSNNVSGVAQLNITTLDATNIEVTNIKAKDGTAAASIADSTGVVTVTAAPVMTALTASQAVFTTAGKALTSNAITGTGNVVMSASPTLTGTISAAAATLSGNLTLSGGTANGVLYLDGSKVATSGSDVVYTGNFGIGTSSPTYKLNVVSGAGVQNIFQAAQSGVSNGYTVTSDGTNLTYQWFTSGSEQMRLTSTGLGIGTSSPGAKLDVNGAGIVRGFLTTTDAIKLGGNTSAPSSTDAFIYRPADNTLAFGTASAEKMRLDSSGNLGLGVTPSAWASDRKALQVNLASLVGGNNNNFAVFGNNVHYDGAVKYIATAAASQYIQNTAGDHLWYNAPSGTAGNTISFTQAMTLDASGNLGVANTSPSSYNGVADNLVIGTYGSNGLTIVSGTSNDGSIHFADGTSGADAYRGQIYYSHAANYMVFGTDGTERARITSGGNLLVGGISDASPTAAAGFKLNPNGGIPQFALVTDTATAATTPITVYNLNATYNGYRFYVRVDGGIGNYQANDINLSDRREKTDFAPAKSYLETICAIPVQTFKYIDQTDKEKTLGVVAQDVQAVAPELVMESNWGTEDNPKMRLSIYQTDLQYALMKCIQEQQALITSLTARVALLEGN